MLDRGALIESVKKQAVMIFGAAQVTLLRDEAYNFLQLGAFLERGDNTARILDVKFHRAAARRQPACRRPRLLRLVGSAGLHRRGPHLPPHLSQLARSDEGRRADDAAARRAALGAPLPVDGRPQHARAGRRLRRARRGRPRWPASCMPGCATPASTRSSRSACTGSWAACATDIATLSRRDRPPVPAGLKRCACSVHHPTRFAFDQPSRSFDPRRAADAQAGERPAHRVVAHRGTGQAVGVDRTGTATR